MTLVFNATSLQIVYFKLPGNNFGCWNVKLGCPNSIRCKIIDALLIECIPKHVDRYIFQTMDAKTVDWVKLLKKWFLLRCSSNISQTRYHSSDNKRHMNKCD